MSTPSFKYGNGVWATKEGSSLAYNDDNGHYKPLPFSVSRASSATRVNKQGLIEVVGNDRLRIDYSESAKGVALLEPSRENKINYSEIFTTSWTRSGIATPTDVSVTAPDGSDSVQRLQTNNTDGSIAFTYNTGFNQVIGTTYTVSVYAKSYDGTDQLFGLFANGSGATYTGNLTATNEWQRFTYTFTAANTSTIGICKGVDELAFDILFWGFQIEVGSYATSYIPTSGSTATRQADVANGAGVANVFNSTEGVLFADIAALANDGTNRIISLSAGNTANTIWLYYDTSNRWRYAVIVGGITQAGTYIVGNILDYAKISVKYKQNDFAFWINGFEVLVDDIGSTYSSGLLTKMSFNQGDGGNVFYGKAKGINVYQTALTDAELEYLTSYRSLAEMVTELNLNAL